MANLVKYNFVVCEEDRRIINSNELMAAKIKELSDAARYVKSEDYDDEFSELLDADKVERLLEDQEDTETESVAEETKQKMLEQAKAEAQAIIESAMKEIEELRARGYGQGEKKGYEEGYQKGLEEAENLKQQILIEKQDADNRYQKQLKEMEPLLVDTLIEIFESTFSIQFAEKKDFIMHLLQSAFSKIDTSKDYLIRISREDYPFMQERKEELRAELPKSANVEIVEDLTLVKNQCLIETDGGVFDCSLDTQMDCLIRDLRMLASM